MKEVCIKCMFYVEVDDEFDENEVEDFSYDILESICPDNLTYQFFEARLEDDLCL